MVQFRTVTENTTTTTTKQSDPRAHERERGGRVCESRRETVDAHFHKRECERKREKNCFQMLMNHCILSFLHTTE